MERNAEQADELKALSSIYGPEFCVENPEDPLTFSIVVPIGDKEGQEATLLVSFPPEYPGTSPPTYQLSVPWIRGAEKQKLNDVLNQIYLENVGKPIVYEWVEKLRELLLETKDRVGMVPAQAQICSSTPSPARFLDMESEGQGTTTCHVPTIMTGTPLTDRKSTFQAHVARVTTVAQVKLVLSTLLQNKKISSATHNMYAYRIKNIQNYIQDCEDDGETHAGGRLMHLLQILNCENVIVIVSRWYGGVMLYGDRFKHINNVARQLLVNEGFTH